MKQAVICTGGSGPVQISVSELGIREGAEIIAADSGYRIARNLGMKPTAVIGDFDSLDVGDLDDTSLEIIRHPAGKDFSDTELAVRLMETRGCCDYLVLGGGEGRLDHTLDICRVLAALSMKHPVRWITRCEHIWFVYNSTLHLEAEPGTMVSLFRAPGSDSACMHAKGLRWDVKGMTCSLSNRFDAPSCSVTVEKGVIMVMLPVGTVKRWSLGK